MIHRLDPLLPLLLAAGLLLSVAPAAAAADLLGPVLPPMELAPGFPAVEALPAGVLRAAVASYERGDLLAARRELEALIQGRRVWGKDRLGARFLLGWISARLGHHQQASANFYRVRKDEEHPLREYASFLEARADMLRGHQPTAIKECDAYLERYEAGRWASECRLVIAQSNMELGRLKVAIERYEEFLDEHPDDQRKEGISLRIAQALEDLGHVEAAGRRYRVLFLDHKLPTTGQEAEAGLRRLEASGAPLPAITDDDLYIRACSLRRSGAHDASYDLFCALDDRNPGVGPDATPLGERLDRERHDFLWRNRQYGKVGANSARAFDRDPTAPDASEHAYWAMQGYSRSGDFANAVKYQREGMTRFPSSSRFRRSEERLGLLLMGAAMYADARVAWQAWAASNSRARRSEDNQFRIAYSAYRAEDYATAQQELEPLAEGRSKTATRARFYLGKVLEKREEWRDGKKAFDQVLKDDPDGWYAQVIRNRRARAKGQPMGTAGRHGQWPGRRALDPSPAATATAVQHAVPQMWRDVAMLSGESLETARAPVLRGIDGRPRLTGAALDASEPAPPRDRAAASAGLRAEAIPGTWVANSRWDPERGREAWAGFAETYGEHWPELTLAFELSQVGLGEIAGPILNDIYREIRDVQRSKRKRRRVAQWKASGGARDDPEMARWSAILDMRIRGRDWLAIFSAAGYPASVSAFAVETIPYKSLGRVDDDARGAWTLAYPAAFAPHVWRAAWENDVDPLLMLSIMRAESLFRHDAVSSAGALGLIQVMPATGAKVAALSQMEGFRVERLLEPDVNISLGTFYMGQLLRRFGPGQFPMAVGSYNGGPHNIGRWLKAKVGADLEDFVEEVAFDETRNYIKKVTSYYAIYADLYADGAPVLLPGRTVPDDSSVIDF